MDYNPQDADSIIMYSQKLKGKSLRDVCGEELDKASFKGKGNFGQYLEKCFYGYNPNSDSEADFKEAGIELKASPLKTIRAGIRAKERLVLNIINYLNVCEENFENSSFWKKNKRLLLIFYLYEKNIPVTDLVIKLIGDWGYPEEDLIIIKSDWEKINQKIRDGKAHELSEGDTFYLGAATKGSTALKSLRSQPFSDIKAKQRAYSLKQGYVNHIIASISNDKESYGKLIKDKPEIHIKSIEEIVIDRFLPFYGKSPSQIQEQLGLDLNLKAKSVYADLTKAILGIRLDEKIEEFEKADIEIKTVRLKTNGVPKEHISFPSFKYEELITESWEDCLFKSLLEKKFFFVFYQINSQNELFLSKVMFWNMPYEDIIEAQKVWETTKGLVQRGEIVKNIKDTIREDKVTGGETVKKIRETYFPKKSDNRVSHVRPHATNSDDVYALPVPDKLTRLKEYTKHSFWLNDSYIKDEIYLK